MIWFNTIVALFLGAFVGYKVGEAAQLPVVISMIVGAIVGAVTYKPREVLSAARRAILDVAFYDVAPGLKQFGLAAANSVCILAGVIIGSFALDKYNGLLQSQNLDGGGIPVLLTMLVAFGLGMTAASDDKDPHANKKFGGVFFGAAFAGVSIIGVPALAIGLIAVTGWSIYMLARGVIALPRAVKFVARVAPGIFFRFAALVATYDRIAVMASCATGVGIGSYFHRAIIAGLGSVLVGVVAVAASKVAIKHRPPVPAPITE